MIKMSLNKLLNKKKRIDSILRNVKYVGQIFIVYTGHQNIGMMLKVFNSLIKKISKLRVEI